MDEVGTKLLSVRLTIPEHLVLRAHAARQRLPMATLVGKLILAELRADDQARAELERLTESPTEAAAIE